MKGHTMRNQPRRHHFVPQFYLAGFTETDSNEGDLYVLDQRQLKTWKNTPKQTAFQRAIDAGPGGDPMGIEKSLSDLEGVWATAIRQVVQQQALPTDRSFADLMIFVAFMAVRVKRFREILSDFVDRASKAEIRANLASEEGRASFRKVIEAQGRSLSDEEFNQVVAFGLSGQFDVEFDRTWHVRQMIETALALAPSLSLRKWVLWTSEDGAPDLICSDSPVAPSWATQVSGPYSPAFGTPTTIVSVPLNRRMAIASMLEANCQRDDLIERG